MLRAKSTGHIPADMQADKLLKWTTTLAALILSFSEAQAQSFLKRIWTKTDSILTTRYYRTAYDTNYVVRPEGKLTLKQG